jgi:hypothetical protein
MSKWVDEEKYNDFAGKKEQEKEKQESGEGQQGFAKKFRPSMGSAEKPKEYEIRFLPDTDGRFYEEYFYHGFYVGESFKFIGCEKNKGLDKYCPWCGITQILYQGSANDKKKAGDYKRKNRYVGNVYVIDDPRDATIENPEYKNSKSVRLYEFPATVETKLKKEVTDNKNGYGLAVFDPENGYSMLLSIGAKKADANKKVWPDYDQTMFARRQSSIADGAELEEIMAQRYSLGDFIEALMITPDAHRELLKSEMVYEDVERDFELKLGGFNKLTTKDEPAKEPAKAFDPNQNVPPVESKPDMGDDTPTYGAPPPKTPYPIQYGDDMVVDSTGSSALSEDDALLASLRDL